MMKGGTKMAMFETASKMMVGEKREDGFYVGEEKVTGYVRELTEHQVVGLLVSCQDGLRSLRRKMSALEAYLRDAVKEDEMDRDTIRRIAETVGIEITMKKTVSGSHTWSVEVEWDLDQEEPSGEEVVDSLQVVSDEYDVDEYQVDNWDEDYDV